MARLRPDYYFVSVTEITPEFLQREAIEGLIIDLDNTLGPWQSETLPSESEGWLDRIRDAGCRVVLVSNAGQARGRRVEKNLDIRVVAPAGKPLGRGYAAAAKLLSLPKEKIAAVGDQIYTDVLGGNRFGVRTILVEPYGKREFPATKIMRLLEKPVRGRIKRRI